MEGLKLFDYFDIIAEPMDLGTIKKKLDHKQYLNAQEVYDDVKLVCCCKETFGNLEFLDVR